MNKPKWTRAAVGRADVLSTVVVGGFLVLLIGLRPTQISTDTTPTSLLDLRGVSELTTCANNLRETGRALQAVMDEHDGFTPTHDDGERVMLTWADLIYDLGYLASTGSQRCPADWNPHWAEEVRGEAWGYEFVDEFGVDEPLKPGVRGSYGINLIIASGWSFDRYPDASRQMLAMDAWWSWVVCLNADWWFYRCGSNPLDCPHWEGTISAWRHSDYAANFLFMDGSVRAIEPLEPAGRGDPTFDTTRAFTWLPGERDDRQSVDSYRGSVGEWWGRKPGFFQYSVNPARPAVLSVSQRSDENAWIKLPNPADRR